VITSDFLLVSQSSLMVKSFTNMITFVNWVYYYTLWKGIILLAGYNNTFVKSNLSHSELYASTSKYIPIHNVLQKSSAVVGYVMMCNFMRQGIWVRDGTHPSPRPNTKVPLGNQGITGPKYNMCTPVKDK
jgi:hypothetical protein